MSLINNRTFECSMGHQISHEDARFHLHTGDGQHYPSNQQVRSCTDLILTNLTVVCQGITPSNSKGGLPAPEAGAHAEEEGVRDEIDPPPSRSEGSQDKAETQSNRVNSAPGWSREERDQEAPLKKEAGSGSDPKSLTRLRNTTSVYPVYIDYRSVAVPRTDQRTDQPY